MDIALYNNAILDRHPYIFNIADEQNKMIYEYEKGYKPLALVSPEYLVSGKPVENEYSIRVRSTVTLQRVYEHVFDLPL